MMLSGTNALRRSSTRLLLAVGLTGALVLALLTTADASSHREAPLIMEDPVADNTDVYAFVSPDDPNSTTLQANFVPFQEAGGGPNYFRFGEDVLYEIHVDNDGDAVEDLTYQFRFRNDIQDPNNYLYATGPIESLDDPNYNFRQTMDVFVVADGERSRIASDLTLPPVNAGPRSTPNYAALAADAVYGIDGGIQVFAGQRDDGFYADIASIFDLGGLRPFNEAHAIPLPTEDGVDTFAGYNVHNISIKVPSATLTAGGDGSDVIGVYSTTSRRKVRVFQQNDSTKAANRGRWIQVSRLGNPLVNEVVVPLAFKDVFNGLDPANDAKTFTGLAAPSDTHGAATKGDIPLVQDPILAAQIEALYGLETPEAPRDDLIPVYLTGIEGLNQPANPTPSEMLRLNTSIPPTAEADRNSLGVIGGDNAGFPNGRRPGDDVIDISLRVVAGVLENPDMEPNNMLTDGVQSNDKPYLDSFPYLATPWQGYELNNPGRLPADG